MAATLIIIILCLAVAAGAELIVAKDRHGSRRLPEDIQ